MTRVEASVIVEVDRAELFHFTDWCYNVPQWFSPVSKTKIVKLPDSSGMGKVTHYDGHLMGRELEWEGTSVDWKENELWAMKAITKLPAKMNMQISMRLETVADSGANKTRATCIIEYQVPYPIIGRLIDRLYIRREIQGLVNSAIEGIKSVADQRKVPPFGLQFERRQLDHPGYTQKKLHERRAND
jgi:hypothetical protein